MKPNRRGFLSLLGAGTAAGPLAVKAAVEAESASLMNMATTGLNGGYGIGEPAESATQSGSYISYEDRVIGVSDYIKMFGVPKSIEETYRLNAQYVNALDPDIVCKRSWSMCVKIQEQKQRNYQRQIENLTQRGIQQRAFKTIKTVLGFDWPW
jgi:hypothetical protein